MTPCSKHNHKYVRVSKLLRCTHFVSYLMEVCFIYTTLMYIQDTPQALDVDVVSLQYNSLC
jgi:hypothetical protein